jgi:hypothetical protein
MLTAGLTPGGVNHGPWTCQCGDGRDLEPHQGVLAAAWYCSITLAGISPRPLTVMP